MAASHQQVHRKAVLAKVREVNEALAASPTNVTDALGECARTPLGFVNDGLRRRVWSRVMGVDLQHIEDYRPFVKDNKYWTQVKLDVDRSASHFNGMRKTTFSKKKQDLEDMIQAILVRNPDLHYYQGFHDICAVLLIVLMDDKLAFAVAEAIAQRQLRMAMQETLEPVVQQLVLMFKLLYHVDLELFDLLRQLEIPVYFALSWHITWFAHDVDDPIVRSRLFDAFIASSPLLPIYVSTALVLENKKKLMDMPEKESDVVHSFLSRLTQSTEPNWERLLAEGARLMRQYPPDFLRDKSDAPVNSNWTHRHSVDDKVQTPSLLQRARPLLLRLAATAIVVGASVYVASSTNVDVVLW